MTAIAMLGYSFSAYYWLILFFAVSMGLGAGAIDTALNNYVAIHYSASVMNYLHCFYGVGITMSPLILARTLNSSAGWRGGYRIVFAIQMAIAFCIFLSTPLWGKKNEGGQEEEKILVMSLPEMVQTPGVILMWILFFSTCAIESICGTWSGTFLVEAFHITPGLAAKYIIFYYAGVAIGRLLSGVLANKYSVLTLVILGIGVLAAGCLMMLFGSTIIWSSAGLLFIGIGNGPMFPNFNHMTPGIFGEEKSPSIIGAQMTVASLAFMTIPVVVGFLTKRVGMQALPVILVVFFVPLFITVFYIRKLIKR